MVIAQCPWGNKALFLNKAGKAQVLEGFFNNPQQVVLTKQKNRKFLITVQKEPAPHKKGLCADFSAQSPLNTRLKVVERKRRSGFVMVHEGWRIAGQLPGMADLFL